MRNYSDYFKTLHDEEGPTGYLGRGTHSSILRATVFHDATGRPLPEAQFADFAVIWDEDHDDRVIEPIEKIYRSGLLSCFVMFGERKGMFTAVLAGDIRDQSRLSFLQDRVNAITTELDAGDSWPAEVVSLEDSNAIISDDKKNVQLYLNNLKMLWQLGLKKPQSQSELGENPSPQASQTIAFRPSSVGPTSRQIRLEIAKEGSSFAVDVILQSVEGRELRLKPLYRGHEQFAKALSMAKDLSEKSGFNGYYEILDQTESAGKKTFSARAEWIAALTEIDRQLEPLKEKSGLNWTNKGGPITPADLAKIPPVGPQLARLMNLRASVHKRQPVEL